MLFRLVVILSLGSGFVFAQAGGNLPAAAAVVGRNHENDIVLKALTKQKWHNELGDIAEATGIRYTSAPPHKPQNPLIIEAIVLIPKGLDRSKRNPFIVLPHQGIHSDFVHAFEFGAARAMAAAFTTRSTMGDWKLRMFFRPGNGWWPTIAFWTQSGRGLWAGAMGG